MRQMRLPFVPVLVLGALSALAGCPSHEDPGGSNPPRFYIAPDGSETRIHLVAVEPVPF